MLIVFLALAAFLAACSSDATEVVTEAQTSSRTTPSLSHSDGAGPDDTTAAVTTEPVSKPNPSPTPVVQTPEADSAKTQPHEPSTGSTVLPTATPIPRQEPTTPVSNTPTASPVVTPAPTTQSEPTLAPVEPTLAVPTIVPTIVPTVESVPAAEATPQTIDTSVYIGLSEQEATELANSKGLTSRVVRIDSEEFMVTMDYSPTRLNFEIDGGKVTSVTLG